ncbi:MAG: hypothetical protein H7147_00680 [Frankiaceae bacterium]|nr:hypothetical protein [Arenimonas sp.]
MALAAAMYATASAPVESADRVIIVSESELGQRWSPLPGSVRVVAGYPTVVSDPSQDVCVNIGFLINLDGSTSNFVEMKSWHAGASEGDPTAEQIRPFAQSAAAAVSLWRFSPVSGKSRPTYTTATFAFDGSKSVASGQIMERCRVDDLPAYVAEARREVEKRGSLTRAQLERMRAMKLDRRKGIQRVSRSEREVGNF